MTDNFSRLEIGDKVNINSRIGVVVYKNDSYITIEYVPEYDNIMRRGKYRESFVRHDINTLVSDLQIKLCS